jgi:hypothetical protein
VHGEVFVWMFKNRPLAVASIYRWYHPFRDSTVEFVSVSEQGITALDGDKTQWNVKQPGIRWEDLPDAPKPAGSRNGRLIQMRSLARRFAAELADERGGDEVARELRLLNRPVHRYESMDEQIIDGALLAFVEGTDPEAWLMLEAVEADGGVRWRYALARMNIDALQIRLDGKVVKTWPNLRDAWTDRTGPYVMFNFDPDALAVKVPPSVEPQSP